MLLKLSEKKSEKRITPTESIIDMLSLINPLKISSWKRGNINSLIIDAKDFLWPLKVSNNLVEQIFPDFEAALDIFTKHFEHIDVITDMKSYNSCEDIYFYRNYKQRAGTAPLLSLIEAKQLYSCLNSSKLNNEHYAVIKIEDQDHFVVSFSAGKTISEITALIESKIEMDLSNLKPIDPVTGKPHKSIMLPGPELTFIFFRNNNVRFDYPFPLRRLKKAETVMLKAVNSKANIETPCCNCLSCTSICPSALSPNILYHLLYNEDIDEIDSYNIDSCIRCGRCSVVCPSNIPLYSGINDYLLSQDEEEDDDVS